MTSASGIDPASLSKTIRPQDDFFRYVNGAWLDSHEIPADRAADGTFHKLRDDSEIAVRKIIEEAPEDSLVGALYRSFMDEDTLNELGTTPLDTDLSQIAAADSPEALAELLGRLQRAGTHGGVGYYVFAAKADPDSNVVYLLQSGLGLPDEAFYREDAHAEVRAKYVEHLERMAQLTGVGFDATTVMAVETALAEHHWDVVRTREAELTYNPTTLSKLETESPGFAWRAWANAIRLPEAAHDLLIASEPGYLTEFARLWAALPLDHWKEWLRWKLVASIAPYLTPDISKANFDFYGTVLSGATEQRVRWKRGVQFVESAAGEAVGAEYVARHFPPSHKEHMDRLVATLIRAYGAAISELDWMTPETKAKALDKLAQFTPKIGYPDKWRDYSGLTASATDLVGNIRASSAFEEDWEWSKIGKPVDRTEWLMSPQTVNAYYLPVANEIVFPAAILQSPFFHPEADDAVNFGGIVAVIGHEVGHGFDDQGSKYDGTGKLDDWWTEADREAFMERANKLIEQFDGYSPKQLGPEHTVNGALTVGENIGDLAGVEVALRAYELALGGSLDNAPEVDGLTGVQRFFIGFALSERTKRRNEALITQINTDPHSPEEFRINGVVRNVDAWYEAFDVREGDELYLAPEDRVTIW